MKEFNDALERLHPEDDTVVRSAFRVSALQSDTGWIVQYDVGSIMEPWVMHVAAGVVQWSHPVDYDVTQLARLQGPQPLGNILGAAENVGSCEPSPDIRWDKTQTTWHTDTKAGRYSVRRVHKRGPFGAFLNNKPVAVDTSLDVQAVKRAVELRIVEARRIANMSADEARKILT